MSTNKDHMLRLSRKQRAMPNLPILYTLASCSLAPTTSLSPSAPFLSKSFLGFARPFPHTPQRPSALDKCQFFRPKQGNWNSMSKLNSFPLFLYKPGHINFISSWTGQRDHFTMAEMSHFATIDVESETDVRNETEDENYEMSEETETENPNPLFDELLFAEFENTINKITTSKNVLRDFRKNEKDLEIVLGHVLDKRRKLPVWNIDAFLPQHNETQSQPQSHQNETYKVGGKELVPYTTQKLRDRRQMYLNKTGLTIPQHRMATQLLAYMADFCAKTSQPKPLYVAWEKILEAGMIPLERTLSTYLYVLSLDSDGDAESCGDGLDERDVVEEVAMIHDALYEPTEKSITLLVKSLVRRGDAAAAEALLDSIADGPLGQLRHRTTSPILKLYCEKGDIDSALRLYHRMKHTSRVIMDAETYTCFIAAAAENGYFRPDSKLLPSAEALGYKPPFGPKLLDTFISEMAEDVLDITETDARVLQNGFTTGFKDSDIALSYNSSDRIGPVVSLCEKSTLVAHRVCVDRDTAHCPATNSTLRLIVLEDKERVHVHDKLLEMAKDKSKEYSEKMAAKGRNSYKTDMKAELASQILKEFSEWLDTRKGKPYTAIIDGANIAYFGWGRINVHQLNLMVKALEDKKENPLVIMPDKYTRKKFYLRRGIIQELKDEELEILESLNEKGQLYTVAPMCHDDMYWMLASVSNQTISTKNNIQSIHVPKTNQQGRFPGLRPIVISNDKMRDHKLDLIEERSFRRWCCSHVVNYNFTEYIENQWEEREISFCAADIFSDEIQGNVCDGGGMAWHFPVREWGDIERFCLRLPM